MSNFWGPFFKGFMAKKLIQTNFRKHFRIRTEKLHIVKVNKSQKKLESIFYGGKTIF